MHKVVLVNNIVSIYEVEIRDSFLLQWIDCLDSIGILIGNDGIIYNTNPEIETSYYHSY
jgi:hypothetical protein